MCNSTTFLPQKWIILIIILVWLSSFSEFSIIIILLLGFEALQCSYNLNWFLMPERGGCLSFQAESHVFIVFPSVVSLVFTSMASYCQSTSTSRPSLNMAFSSRSVVYAFINSGLTGFSPWMALVLSSQKLDCCLVYIFWSVCDLKI